MYLADPKVLVILLVVLSVVSSAKNATTTTPAPKSSTTEATPESSKERPSVLKKLGEGLLAIPLGIVEAFKFGAEACEDFWDSVIGE